MDISIVLCRGGVLHLKLKILKVKIICTRLEIPRISSTRWADLTRKECNVCKKKTNNYTTSNKKNKVKEVAFFEIYSNK